MSEAHARAWWEDVQHLREAAEQRIAERERAQRDGRLRARADRSPSAVTGSATALTSSSGPRATPSLPVTGSPAAITSSSAPPAAPPAALAGSAVIAAVPDPVDPALAPVRRRSRPGPSAAERFAARPDRIAQWAFLLGLFLILVAAVSAHG